MAADFSTMILMKGTNEELFAMIMVLKKMEEHNRKRNCPYFEYVNISRVELSDITMEEHNRRRSYAYFKYVNRPGVELSDITDDQIKEIIESSNGTISAGAVGPFGPFAFLDEVHLFENMAEAAPNAYFDGLMEGFDAGGDQVRKGVLKNKKLHVYTMFREYGFCDDDEDADGWDDEAIYDPITKKWD